MNAQECPFCAIARGELRAVVLYEDEALVAFLDRSPIRPGHTQVIPKVHLPYFDDLPAELASRIVACGQLLARRMKATFGVERVAFAFTGGDVPHAHAHVVPLHSNVDVTSAQYIVGWDGAAPRWSSEHLLTERADLEAVRASLGFGPESAGAGP